MPVSTVGMPLMDQNDEPPSDTGHTRVYLVDDHPPIRDAISETLSGSIDLEMCGEAAHLDPAIREIDTLSPDVVIVDISLSDGHGLTLVRKLQSMPTTVRSLVYSMYDEQVYAERALRAGANGYLMKTEPPHHLVDAIRDVARGEMYLSSEMASRILGGRGRDSTSELSFAIDELTNREMEVFQLLGEGKHVEEIQEELGLNRKTIETYRRRAKEKLGVNNISELLQYAVQWTQAPDTNPPVSDG